MYLHFDPDILLADFRDFLGAIAKTTLAHDKHGSLSRNLQNPNGGRTSARFTMAANCVDCSVSHLKTVQTIWERGSPISISLEDGTCPRCQSKRGFHYASLKSMHA